MALGCDGITVPIQGFFRLIFVTYKWGVFFLRFSPVFPSGLKIEGAKDFSGESEFFAYKPAAIAATR